MHRLMQFRRLTRPKPARGPPGTRASGCPLQSPVLPEEDPLESTQAFSWLDEAPTSAVGTHRWHQGPRTGLCERWVPAARALARSLRRPRPVRVGGAFARYVRMWHRSEGHRRPVSSRDCLRSSFSAA